MKAIQPDQVIEAGRLAHVGRDVVAKPGAFARLSYSRALEGDDGCRDEASKYEAKLSEWPSFVREAFTELFDPDGAKPLSAPEVSPWGAKAFGVLRQQGSFGELRVASQAHRAIAATATAGLAAAVADAMKLRQVPDGDGSGDPRTTRDAIDDAALAALDGVGHSMMTPEGAASMDKALKLQASRRQWCMANVEQALKDGSLAAAVEGLAKEASQSAAAVKVLRGCGIGSAGATDPDGEIPAELIKQIGKDPLLLKLLDFLGRVQRCTAANQLAKTSTASGEMVGVTVGNEVAKLVGHEMAMLGSEMEDDVLKRVAESAASVWDNREVDSLKRGPFVVILDRSSSMLSEGRWVFSRAMTIASMVAAHAQRRAVALVTFAGRGTAQSFIVPVGDTKALREAILGATVRPSGDTDIGGALDAAKHASSKLPPGADVLLITDACFPPPPRAITRGACGANGRLFVVGLGDGARLAMPDADRVFAITGEASEQNAASVLGAMQEVPRGRA